MPNEILPHDEILKLRAAVISAGLSTSRKSFLTGIDAAFVAGLSDEGSPGNAILNDLGALNTAGALEDGSVPLVRWLQNAVELAGPRQEVAVFRGALERANAWKALALGGTEAAASASPGAAAAVQPQSIIYISGSTIGGLGVGPGAQVTGSATVGGGSASSPHPSGTASSSETESAIDFAILTAIEVERRAVCAAFGMTDKNRVRKDGRVYWRGQFALPNGLSYQIVVAQPRDMGQVESALLASDVIRHWSPNAALLVGIAASTDKDVRLGDVVAGRSVYYYEHGKVTPDGTKPQPEMIDADPVLMNTVVTLSDWDGAVPVARPDGSNDKPKLHQGVIASGEKVIADVTERNRIASGHRKIVAIEMEGYGFSRAVWQSFERVRHLDIRAICDEGSKDKTDGWHKYAAASASAFAKHFLSEGLLTPRNASTPDP